MTVSVFLGLFVAALFGSASAWPFSGASATTPGKIRLRVDPLGIHSFALYGVPDPSRMEHDTFWAITNPGEMAPVEVDANSSFVLRSTDMKFRTIISVDMNHDLRTKASYPWKICFSNPMVDYGAKIELKHSTSGFNWIEEGQQLCQATDHSHDFELHDREKAPIFTIKVRDPRGEL
mmetsp:Transcript_122819/g.333537  ORF Transcript_122819/g.333537 Transcript_122819/m.333537 type:complete len:177 (-) Transcript_122819:173-703(-)